MKELTAATILALHALHLMVRSARPVSAREIQRSSGFAADQVRRVVARLQKAGVIRGNRGHGWQLARAPGEISIQNVVQAMNEPKAPKAPCGGDFDACDSRASCILSPICRNAEKGYQDLLRSFTIAELIEVPPGLPNCMDPALRRGAS